MRFRPDDRVIELLVGEDLYSTPDAAIRELLQNAEDACWLFSRSAINAEYTPQIIVRFSARENWVEVEDNGIGMDEATLENSFVAIGAPKTAVPHIAKILAQVGEDRQIAKFGIGILSCFGIASRIELWTKMDSRPGMAYQIPDYHADFVPLADSPEHRGTRVRLYLKESSRSLAADTPTATAKHARHAPHVTLADADTGETSSVPSQWAGEDIDGALEVKDRDVVKGVLALNPEWGRAHHVAPRLIVCNGGFLVSELITDLLPPDAIGYVGELDIKPGSLRILMNREQFKRDAAWEALQRRLGSAYNDVLSRYIAIISNDATAPSDEETADAAVRRIVVLTRGPAQGALTPEVRQGLDSALPGVLLLPASGESAKRSLRTYIERCRSAERTLYYYRSERERHNVQGRIDSTDSTIHITETIQMSMRVSLLRAKGDTVVPCKLLRYQETSGKGNFLVDAHEADLLVHYAAAAGVTARAVDKATYEELDLHWSPQSQLLGKVLNIGGALKIAHLPASRERVVRDFDGRILNSAHEEVQEVMRTLPDAAGNPIRRALIQLYMDLANHQFADARDRVLELLLQEDLEDLAALRGGRLQREYLRRKVAEMLSENRAV